MSREIDIREGRGHYPEDREIHFEHYVGDELVGEVTCFPNESGDGYRIGVINTTKPGGVGKEFVRRVVEIIGKNQPIELGGVIEADTTRRLDELGLLDEVRELKQRITLTEPNTLRTLKMVRVLQGGGINVGSVSLEFKEDWDFFEENPELNQVYISIFGKT